jgi:uncharacterized protein (DUF488 family)
MPQDAGVMTVGYQGRGVDELLDALTGAGVRTVVDVRLTPLSRKPGLSKTRLAAALSAAGIDYLHLPQLGNPRDNRAGYRSADIQAIERFRAQLGSPSAVEALEQLRKLAAATVIALLCFERDAATCHRALIGEAITAAAGHHIEHL